MKNRYSSDFKIGKKWVGPGHTPFLIAEMSGNHNQSLERALKIVEAAAKSGAHALKLQTYTPDTMTIDFDKNEFFIDDPCSLWKGKSLYKLYAEAYTPWEWHKPLFQKCKELGMECFSTPFDETAVDFLEELKVDCYKIASFENTCTPLLKKVAKTGKPMIMSTGMANLAELSESVKTLKDAGAENIVLLKCTSTYPATAENCHIRTIPNMRDTLGVHIGLSDHTMGCGVAIASTALGAVVIEKHFTLNRADGGVDSTFSMEPAEFKLMSEEVHKAWQSLGEVTYGTEVEEKSKVFRRSIYVCEDIKAGETFDSKNVRCIRPGNGLAPKHYEDVIGKKASMDLKRGMPFKINYIKPE